MEKKDRLRKMCQEALNMSFNGYTITEYKEVPTHKLDDTGTWVKDSKAIFITCKYDGNYLGYTTQYNKLGEHLENLFGFECIVQIL